MTTSRYVSIKNGNDSNPGTKSDPYKTIQRGIDELRAAFKKSGGRPGKVLIEDGIYDEQLTLYDDIQLLRADEKVAVTIDSVKGTWKASTSGSVQLTRTKKGGPLIAMTKVKRATVRGLKLDGQGLGGRAIDIDNSSAITIEGCVLMGHRTYIDYQGRQKGTVDDPYMGDSFVKDSSSGAAIRLRNSKKVDIKSNFFFDNRCDQKFAIPNPFDAQHIPSSIELRVPGVASSKTLRQECAIRLLKTQPEIYRNGGGAVFVEDAKYVTIDGNLFRANQAARGGAVRFGNKAYETITGNYFVQNEAWVDGGAIAIWDYDRSDMSRTPITIKDCRFANNKATDDGGAVYLTAMTIANVQQCGFSANESGSNGGALRVTFGSRVVVEQSTFVKNVANTDADTKETDNKDGGGAVAAQNASVTLKKCVFTGNRVKGFAGGAIYVNTVEYEQLREALGRAVFGEGFDEILKRKYKLLTAELAVTDCEFSENTASGKTCYAPEASTLDNLNLLGSNSCDDIIKSLEERKKNQRCSLKTGTGMTEGGAGGAIYLLESKSRYLPLGVTIQNTTFKNDISEYKDKERRAEIVAVNCSTLEFGAVTITISSPTLYKLSLEDVVVRNAGSSGLDLTCSNSKVSSSDAEIHLHRVTCR